MELSSDEIRLIQQRRATKMLASRVTTLDATEKCWLAYVLEDLKAEVQRLDKGSASAVITNTQVIAMIDRRIEALDGGN